MEKKDDEITNCIKYLRIVVKANITCIHFPPHLDSKLNILHFTDNEPASFQF